MLFETQGEIRDPSFPSSQGVSLVLSGPTRGELILSSALDLFALVFSHSFLSFLEAVPFW